MSLTNAPAIITQLSTQLQACASWTAAGLSTNVWYPSAPEGTSGPFAVLGFDSQRFTKYAEGAEPVRSGDLFVTIWKADTAGNLEELASNLVNELMTADTGIPFRDGENGRAELIGPAKEAAGETLNGISFTLSHGLTP